MSAISSVVQDYVSRLRQGVEEDYVIREFKERFHHRFQELCMVHLSFLIDIPWNVFDQRTTVTQENTPKSALRRLLAGSRINPQQIKPDAIPSNLAGNVIALIDRLNTDEACSTEGIFRKAGHMIRKNHLHEAIFQPSFHADSFPWDIYTVHDLASALKSILVQLPSPMLTDKLMPLFLQVAALHKCEEKYNPYENVNELFDATVDRQHLDLVQSKQLKSLRLLVQLLPPSNFSVLRCLTELLVRVVRLQARNRMTSACLGTVFGPVFFPHGVILDPVSSSKHSRLLPAECHERYKQFGALITILIETGMDIFLLPRSLAEDVHSNSLMLSEFLASNRTDVTDPTKSQAVPNSVHSPQSKLHNKRGSAKFRELSSPVSPSRIRENSSVPNDSPPLHTSIRFATPTVAPTTTQCATSPSPSANSRISPTAKSRVINTEQTNTIPVPSIDIHDDSKSAEFRIPGSTQHNQVVIKQLHLPGGSFLTDSIQKLPRVSVFPKSSIATVSRRSSLIIAPTGTLTVVAEPNTTPIKHSMSITDLDNPGTCNVTKKRRYTELRIPNSAHRSGQRRHIFSPCPPLRFLPFRRYVAEKHVSPPAEIQMNFAKPHAISTNPSC
ncbi:unnamed protein product [Calicophoron daubneyi]|uniref:Rho-GAP domain-containing protein n=1 Tax=Calicophoron daubneyi TaxID=300641 RepID=A0AAV2T3M8_CALDB